MDLGCSMWHGAASSAFFVCQKKKGNHSYFISHGTFLHQCKYLQECIFFKKVYTGPLYVPPRKQAAIPTAVDNHFDALKEAVFVTITLEKYKKVPVLGKVLWVNEDSFQIEYYKKELGGPLGVHGWSVQPKPGRTCCPKPAFCWWTFSLTVPTSLEVRLSSIWGTSTKAWRISEKCKEPWLVELQWHPQRSGRIILFYFFGWDCNYTLGCTDFSNLHVPIKSVIFFLILQLSNWITSSICSGHRFILLSLTKMNTIFFLSEN